MIECIIRGEGEMRTNASCPLRVDKKFVCNFTFIHTVASITRHVIRMYKFLMFIVKISEKICARKNFHHFLYICICNTTYPYFLNPLGTFLIRIWSSRVQHKSTDPPIRCRYICNTYLHRRIMNIYLGLYVL